MPSCQIPSKVGVPAMRIDPRRSKVRHNPPLHPPAAARPFVVAFCLTCDRRERALTFRQKNGVEA